VSAQRQGPSRPYETRRPNALRRGMPDQAEIGRQVSRIELNRPQESAKRFLRSAARLVQKSEDVVVIGYIREPLHSFPCFPESVFVVSLHKEAVDPVGARPVPDRLI